MISEKKSHLKLVPASELNTEERISSDAGQHMAIAKFNQRKMDKPRRPRREAQTSGAGNLCDFLIYYLGLKNDAALARTLSFPPPRISKLRHLTCPVSGEVLIRMHEVSDLSIRRLRALMGDHRNHFGIDE